MAIWAALAAILTVGSFRRDRPGMASMNPDGMVASDTDGRIVLVNGLLEKLSGFLAEELIGQQVDAARLAGDHGSGEELKG